jgi:sugar phosphate permease
MNIAIASIITAPLSGWILIWGDWRDLFFIEGAFPFLIAARLWWLLVADRPADAAWAGAEEREYIETSLEREKAAAPAFAGFREVFRSSVVCAWSWCTSSSRSASTASTCGCRT